MVLLHIPMVYLQGEEMLNWRLRALGMKKFTDVLIGLESCLKMDLLNGHKFQTRYLMKNPGILAKFTSSISSFALKVGLDVILN